MPPVINYKPYRDRTIDAKYHRLLAHITKAGVETQVIQGQRAKTAMGRFMVFKMENGFPVITERDMSGALFRAALGEHIGFLNGARTHEELKQFGCPYWHPWVTEEKCSAFGLTPGDLGDASYGMAWTQFPTTEGVPFNQMRAMIDVFRKMPFLRTMRITNWIPHYIHTTQGFSRRVVVAPCHGDIYIRGFPETKELIITHVQRSADSPVGLAFNLIQYAAFGMMFAQVVGYTFTELHYFIVDGHIYEMQYAHVDTLLSRAPHRFPTVSLDPDITDMESFRPEHFHLHNDYEPHPKMFIPTPI